MNGDEVLIEVLPESQWTAPARVLKVRNIEESEKQGALAPADNPDAEAADEVNEQLEADEDEAQLKPKSVKKDDLVPTGRVVGIVRRNWRQYCGVLMMSPIPGARRHLFAPADSRIPRIRIETRQAELLTGK